jgi:hypothetical protein
MTGTGSRGVPRAGAARCLLPAANFMSHNVLLSERANLSLISSGRALPAQAVTARPWPNPRSTSSLARDSLRIFERERTDISGQRQRSLPVLPVTTAGTARGRDTPIKKRFVPPACRGGRRHGQTDVVLASRRVTAGRLAFAFAAGLTARGGERSGQFASMRFNAGAMNSS